MRALAAHRKRRRWTVYVVRCRDGSLYTGITDALEARIEAHNSGKGAKYTRSRRPVRLVWRRGRQTASEARRLEAALKRASKAEKEKLVAGDEGIWRCLRRVVRRREA